MTLQDIESFLAVVQKGNLTGAADMLHITQPTLTHRIKSLENELGTELIIRQKGVRMIELTPAGQGFVPIAEKWSRLWKETLNMTENAGRKTLEVVATTTLGTYVMNEVYARFLLRGHPLVLDVNTLHSEEAYLAVENGDADIAFTARTMPSNRVSAIPVFSEKMVLLCRKDYPWEGIVHPSELPPEKCVHLFWTHEYSLWHERWFGAGTYVVDADSMILAERIIEKTDLWMIAPLTAAVVASGRSNIKMLEIQDGPPDRVIYSLTRGEPDSYTGDLIEDLVNTVNDLKSQAQHG